MEIASCSGLLRRRYKNCIPLLGISRRSQRRQLDDDNTTSGDVAFLSSVEFPGELCLSLACIAWRRTQEGPLLVFVPFEEPRGEIFAEIPLGAFIDERKALHNVSAGTKKKGMCMISLNEHSFLCSSVRDGLPPRRGLFITFRTSESGRLFRATFDSALRGELHIASAHTSHTATHISSSLLDGTRGNEAIRYRKDQCDASPILPPSYTDALPLMRTSPARETESFINGLLAERDRRREAYLFNAHAPSDRSGSNFHEWAQAHRLRNPSVWNMLAGASERKVEAEGRQYVDSVDDQLANGISSFEDRSLLLRDLREAMKAFDQMSNADISLVGAARDFLRGHQDDLWSTECGERRKPTSHEPSPVPPFPSHKDRGRISVPENVDRNAGISVVSAAANTMSEHVVPLHLSPEPILPEASPAPAQQVSQSPEHQKRKDRIQEETERAMAIEARLVASIQKAPPNSMMSKPLFGTTSNTSTAQPISQLSPTPNVGVEKSSANVLTDSPVSEIKEKASPLCCGEKWKAVYDSNKDKYYYVHKETKKTTWRVEETFASQTENVQHGTVQELKSDETAPKVVDAEPKCGPGWRPVVDPNTGRTYYVNVATKAVTWKVKDTLVKTSDTTNAPKETKTTTEWTERQDPASGKTYYYNKKTKQTTWKRSETDLGVS